MPAIIVLLIAFLVGLLLHWRGISGIKSWLLSSLVMPLFVLAAEFILPYMGGGASMWPIALVIGGFLGMLAGGLGVAIASLYLKEDKTDDKDNIENSNEDNRKERI